MTRASLLLLLGIAIWLPSQSAEAGLFGRRSQRGKCCGRAVQPAPVCCPPAGALAASKYLKQDSPGTPTPLSSMVTCEYKCKASDPVSSVVVGFDCLSICTVVVQACGGTPVWMSCNPICPECLPMPTPDPVFSARQRVKHEKHDEVVVTAFAAKEIDAIKELAVAREYLESKWGKTVYADDVIRVEKHPARPAP